MPARSYCLTGRVPSLSADASANMRSGSHCDTRNQCKMNGHRGHAEVLAILASLGAGLTACGGGGSGSSSSGSGGNGGSGSTSTSHTIGGSISGLNGTASLSLNGGPAQTVSSDGSFVFSSSLPSGDTYAVTVVTAPSGETCAVTKGSGTVGSANITNVTITCSVPSGTSVPPNTYSATSFQSGYFARLNSVRQALGVGSAGAVERSPDTSSQAQALYNRGGQLQPFDHVWRVDPLDGRSVRPFRRFRHARFLWRHSPGSRHIGRLLLGRASWRGRQGVRWSMTSTAGFWPRINF